MADLREEEKTLIKTNDYEMYVEKKLNMFSSLFILIYCDIFTADKHMKLFIV